jgi:hypothetical protein
MMDGVAFIVPRPFLLERAMARSNSHQFVTPHSLPRTNFLQEIDRFFEGKGQVQQTLRRLVKRLEKANIPYAIVGGMAVNAHGHERMTKDVDVLLTREGLLEFRRLYVPEEYEPVPKRGRRFVDLKNQRTVDILVAGLFPGRGDAGPIPFPNPSEVREQIKKIYYIDLVTLVQLKLAARRHQDFADVVNLINVHNLDEAFLDRLHPSLHRDFIECLEEKRREDEYLERNG